MKNILVTGGAGFIGSNFVRFMLEKEYNIINLDALTYAGSLNNLSNLPNEYRHTFIHGTILDENKVSKIIDEYDIDTLVNFAAETHVDRSIDSSKPFMYTNTEGTMSLLEAVKNSKKDIRFHQISTDEVFGSLRPNEPAWDEECPYKPNSPYSASKASADHFVRAYGHTHGINYTVSYCTNNYGERQHPEKLIPMCITNAIRGKIIPVYGDGRQIRDWVYVLDHCSGIYDILLHGKSGEAYNIGGNNQSYNLDIITAICDIVKEIKPEVNATIQFVEDRKGHDRRYSLDTHKLFRLTGWKPQTALNDGLRKTVEWYIKEIG